MCPTRYRTPLAGGPLLRVATIRRTIHTYYRHIPLHFSHNERTPVQIRCNILIGVRIIKEMPGSVASGTPYISAVKVLSPLVLYTSRILAVPVIGACWAMVLSPERRRQMVTVRVSAALISKVSTPTSDRIRFADWLEVSLTNVNFTEALVLLSRIQENHE